MLRLVVAPFVIFYVFQRVGQILLLHPAVGKYMGIQVVLLVVKAGGIGVDVLEAPGDVPAFPLLDRKSVV